MTRSTGIQWSLALAAIAAASGLATVGLTGCGTPGAPLPPSLNLPDPVTDLSATRTGNVVKLTWTMPAKNTDKLKLKDNVLVHICRREGDGPCTQAGADQSLPPKANGIVTETLPHCPGRRPSPQAQLLCRAQNKRAALRVIERGHDSCRAGSASSHGPGCRGPAKGGVVLHWNATASTKDSGSFTAIRLHRNLIGAPTQAPGTARLARP